jgi:hypothetical protein
MATPVANAFLSKHFAPRRLDEGSLALQVVEAMMAAGPEEVRMSAEDEETAALLRMAVHTVCAIERWKAETRPSGRRIDVIDGDECVKTVIIA